MVQFDNAIKKFRELILDELEKAGIPCWIAGGAVRDYFMGVHGDTDYDIFFSDHVWYEMAFDYFIKNDAVIKWESDNGAKVVYKGHVFDLIKHFWPTPGECINAFDFSVCMFAIDSKKVYHGETSFIDLAKRQLMINQITYPASTMRRAFRYYNKGFKMCAGEMMKVAEALQEEGKKMFQEDLVKALNPDAEPQKSSTDTPPSGDNEEGHRAKKFFAAID